MQPKNKNWEISKNVIDLEYKKLLHEYNAYFIAITSVTLGLLAFAYNVTKNLLFSITVAMIVYFALDSKRFEVSKKLNLKIKEAKNLKY